MDGKYLKPHSNFLPMECSRRCDGGVHRISELPDEIVLVILSFLSLRESVTTSVLSSRWSDLWKHIPNLNLDAKLLTNQYKKPIRRSNTWFAERCKYIEIVNSVLQSHKAPSLKEFRISLIADESVQCAVTKWLEFVLSRQVERLELDLQCQGTCIMVSSYVVSLEELVKDGPQNLIGFKSLKSLCLKGFNMSGEAIDSFQRYTHQRNWYLRISQKLDGADFDTRTRPEYAKHFASAARLQFLTLDLFYPDVFFANAFPQIPTLKKLAVKYSGAYEHGLFPVTALIRASPRLQVFRLEVVSQLRFHSTFQNGERHWHRHRHRHRHLKAFEFSDFSEGAVDHIELLKYILDNCVALQKIILWRPSLSWAEPQFARDLLEQLLDGEVPEHIRLYIV